MKLPPVCFGPFGCYTVCHTVLRHWTEIIKRDSDFVIDVVVVFVENVEAAKDNKYVRSEPHEVLLTKSYRWVGCIFEQRLLLAQLMTNITQIEWVRGTRDPFCFVPLPFEPSNTDNVFAAVHIYLPTVPNGMWKMVAWPQNVKCYLRPVPHSFPVDFNCAGRQG